MFDILIPVEKQPTDDIYFVVGKYAIFEYFYKEEELVYCVVEDYSGELRDQLLKIARRFLFHHHTSQTEQHMIDQLTIHRFTEEEILRLTYFQPNQRNSYFYNRTVPDSVMIQNEQLGRPSSIATVNQITILANKLVLPDPIRIHLFTRTQSRTLTQEQLKSIRNMLDQTEGFLDLTDIQRKLSNLSLVTKHS